MSSQRLGHVLSLMLHENCLPCIFYGVIDIHEPADYDGNCLRAICEALNFARASEYSDAQVLINCPNSHPPSIDSRIAWLKQILHELCEAFADDQGDFAFSEFKPLGGDKAPQIAFTITWTRKQPA